MKLSLLEERVDDRRYVLAGVFFLIVQVIVIYANFQQHSYGVFFWFCNHTPLLFSLAFFSRRVKFVKALISVGFLAQVAWTLDFISKILFNVYLLDITRYVFEGPHGWTVLVPVLIHILGTNIALYLTYKRKTRASTLVISFMYLVVLEVVTFIFVPAGLNINCIYQTCGIGTFGFTYYTLLWPLIIELVLVVPAYFIQKLLYRVAQHSSTRKHIKNLKRM